MLKVLGVGWTTWKLAKKRFGTVGGIVAAAIVVGFYVVLLGWLRDNYPDVAEALE